MLKHIKIIILLVFASMLILACNKKTTKDGGDRSNVESSGKPAESKPIPTPGVHEPYVITDSSKIETIEGGVKMYILERGSGKIPATHDELTAHYEGRLLNGKKFDSSWDRGAPSPFPLNRVIPGWTVALSKLPVGTQVQLIIPGAMAYGAQGRPPHIPPNATLVFDVDMVSVKELPPPPPPPTPIEHKPYVVKNKSKVQKLEGGVEMYIVEKGNGPIPTATSTISAFYEGRLAKDESIFDSAWKRGQAASFPLNQVIRGWTVALSSVPVGSKVRLLIPPAMGYGEKGAGGAIPPNATLIFDVEVVSMK